MWVREVETVDRIWKTDVKNTANLMNEMMNRRNREEARNTARQPDYRTEPPARNENCNENRYHPYRSRSDRVDRDQNDRDHDQDRGYKYRDNDHNNQDRGYKWTRDNDRNGQDHT
jgi:hypothetical protein